MIMVRSLKLRGHWSGCLGEWLFGKFSLTVLIKAPNQAFNLAQLEDSAQDTIILAGHCEDAESIEQGSRITPTRFDSIQLNPLLYEMALNLTFPLIVLEGFGKHSLNIEAFQLFSRYDRHEVIINAEGMGSSSNSSGRGNYSRRRSWPCKDIRGEE